MEGILKFKKGMKKPQLLPTLVVGYEVRHI